MEVQRAQRSALNNITECKTLMPSGRMPRSGCMGLHMVRGANNVLMGTHPVSIQDTELSVGNVTQTNHFTVVLVKTTGEVGSKGC